MIDVKLAIISLISHFVTLNYLELDFYPSSSRRMADPISRPYRSTTTCVFLDNISLTELYILLNEANEIF